MENNAYLLLVDDDEMVQKRNKLLLEGKYPLKQALTLEKAREIMKEFGMPRAMVLDVMLPDGNGVDFLHEIRKYSNVPVLMLTSQNTQQEILNGLNAGGDYYLVKPCNQMIFVSHVEALLRRAAIVPDALTLGTIKLEPTSMRASVNGEDMGLSQKEFALLQQFVQHPKKILLASQLYQKVWGQEMLPGDKSLKASISRLRIKLLDSKSGFVITSEYGEGYILEDE